jgi:hypothetical protein
LVAQPTGQGKITQLEQGDLLPMHKVTLHSSGFNRQIDLFDGAERHQRRHHATPQEAWLHDRFGIPHRRARLIADHAGLGMHHE